MPAEFMLNALGSGPQPKKEPFRDSISDKNQLVSQRGETNNGDFDRQFKQEVDRSRQRAGTRHSADSTHSNEAGDRQAAKTDTNSRQSGNNLPDRSVEKAPQESDQKTENEQSGQKGELKTTEKQAEKASETPEGAIKADVSKSEQLTQGEAHNQQLNAQSISSDNSEETLQLLESRLHALRLLDPQNPKLADLENQLKKIAGTDVGDLNIDKLSQQIDDLASQMPARSGFLTGELARMVSTDQESLQIATTQNASQAMLSMEQRLKALLSADDRAKLVSVDGATPLQVSDNDDKAADDLDVDELTKELVAQLKNIIAGVEAEGAEVSGQVDKATLENNLSEIAPDLSDADKAQVSDILQGLLSGEPLTSEQQQQLAKLGITVNPESGQLRINGQAVNLNVIAGAAQISGDLQGKSASTQNTPIVSGSVDSQIQTNQPDASKSTEVDVQLKNLEKFALKNKDKLSELSVGELANQAKQLAKLGDGELQQKIKDAVQRIQALATDTARDSASSESGGRTSTGQPITQTSAFGKAMEQASANHPVQKTVMTMQNHFSKANWGAEVGQRLMMMVGQKIQSAEIRLDPPDLGPMEVKVRMQQEQASVVFNSQHAAVRDALEQALPRLREMFEQNGLSLGDVDVQDQTAEQRQGDDESGGALVHGDEELPDETQVAQEVQVLSSDRLVDYYA